MTITRTDITPKTPLLATTEPAQTYSSAPLEEKAKHDSSKISWDSMPDDVKFKMGSFLLKPNVISQPATERDIDMALRNRYNLDIAYADHSAYDYFKYTKMPANMTCSFFEDTEDQCTWADEVYDFVSENDPPCGCCMAICACAISSTTSIIHILVGTPLGLFADCGRAIKRKHDIDNENNKNEVLHRQLTGPAIQVMR